MFETFPSLPESRVEAAKTAPSRFGDKEKIRHLMRGAEEEKGEIRILGDISELFPDTTAEHANKVEIAQAIIHPDQIASKLLPVAVTGDDGTSLLHIFKPFEGENERIRTALGMPSYYIQEEAAYLVSEHFGFDLVPPTIVRSIGGKIGSLQLFVDPKKYGTANNLFQEMSDEQLDGLVESDDYRNTALLDFIILNSDRKSDNFLIEGDLKDVVTDLGGYMSPVYEAPADAVPHMVAIDHGTSMYVRAYRHYFFDNKDGVNRAGGPSYTLSTEFAEDRSNLVTGGSRVPARIAIPEKQRALLEDGWNRIEDLRRMLVSLYDSHAPKDEQGGSGLIVDYLIQRVKALLVSGTYMHAENTNRLPQEAINPLSPHPPLRRDE